VTRRDLMAEAATRDDMQVRRARENDRDRMLELWERSVRATHHFLSDSDIVALRPMVADELASAALMWWVATSDADIPIGLLAFAGDVIEGLFVDPDHRGQGVGTALVAHAQALHAGSLAVDVNEQNDAALGFYIALGFVQVGRSPTDSAGRPFPILHLRRPGPSPSPAGEHRHDPIGDVA
jgi:putative acetyltransferase